MTPEMAFECLLVSHDPAVFCTMHRILKDFSIATNICLSTSKATDLLEEGSTDLIVIDWDPESSPELLQEISKSLLKQKPTVLAVASDDQVVPGVHVLVRKPITPESGTHSIRTAYSRMLMDFRKHVRYAVMAEVYATGARNRTLPVIVGDIGEGGVGIRTKEKLSIGEVLSFVLPLPGTAKEISIQARVLWTRPYGIGGCQFVRIPPSDLEILNEWLISRCRIKTPLVGWTD